MLHAHHVPSCDVISRKCARGATVLTDWPSPTSGNRRPQFVYTSRSKDRRKSILRAVRLRLVLRLSSEQHASLNACRTVRSLLLRTYLWLGAHKMRELYAQRENKNKQTHTHTQRHRQTQIDGHRQTDRQTERQADRQTDRRTDGRRGACVRAHTHTHTNTHAHDLWAIPNMRGWHVSGGSCDSQVSQEEEVWLCICPVGRRQVKFSDRLISYAQVLRYLHSKPPSSSHKLQQSVLGCPRMVSSRQISAKPAAKTCNEMYVLLQNILTRHAP